MFWNLLHRTSGVRSTESVEPLLLGPRSVPLLLVHNPRARRYLLRLRPDGTARVTIPRGGSREHARKFADQNRHWLEKQFQRLQSRSQTPAVWPLGAEVWFRGEWHRLEAGEGGVVRLGFESIPVKDMGGNLRPEVECHLRALATRELPPCVLAHARQQGLTVQRVTVRNQRSRWGSCSRRGTISLNWRLIQVPPFVSDYIILHELAHLRHMNHSPRFWQEVEGFCPAYLAAEQWLKTHRLSLR